MVPIMSIIENKGSLDQILPASTSIIRIRPECWAGEELSPPKSSYLIPFAAGAGLLELKLDQLWSPRNQEHNWGRLSAAA